MCIAATRDARANTARNELNAATTVRNYRMANPGAISGAISGAFRTVGGIGGAMMGNYGSALKATGAGKEFRDQIMPEPKWDKVNADNTAKVGEKMDALNKSITELANELRSRTP